MAEPAPSSRLPGVAEVDELAQKLLAGERRALSRAITLVESVHPSAHEPRRRLLSAVFPRSGGALRLAVSGPPGAGKSSVIDALGRHAIARGERVAVLAVDPSSRVSGGSLLGDKIRMARLSQDPASFIRPSPTAGLAGGVARRTREATLLCEAAGYSWIVIETVGVGQTEYAVAGMVDCFLLVLAPGGGDEIQGMKRGILEVADIVAVNKADRDDRQRAERARADLRGALSLFSRSDSDVERPVLLASALEETGIAELYDAVQAFAARARESGAFDARRAEQRLAWFREAVDQGLRERFLKEPRVAREFELAEASVARGEEGPADAAERLLSLP
jgi:LAO/AO transport system kinase